MNRKLAQKMQKSGPSVDFSRNVLYYYIAVGVIILGYIVLSMGNADSFTSLTLGPILLVIGYLAAIPIALLGGVRKRPDEAETLERK